MKTKVKESTILKAKAIFLMLIVLLTTILLVTH